MNRSFSSSVGLYEDILRSEYLKAATKDVDGSVDEVVTMHEYLRTRDFVSRLFLVSTLVTQHFSFLRREGALRARQE